MSSHRWFFVLAVPAGWAALSLLHFHFPGDEYGLWAVSSLAEREACSCYRILATFIIRGFVCA